MRRAPHPPRAAQVCSLAVFTGKQAEVASWVRLIIERVADNAADEQEDYNRHFVVYAASAAACKRALQYSQQLSGHYCPARNDQAKRDQQEAYELAHGELEAYCTNHPYHPMSQKYRCSCGTSVVYCQCMVLCECGKFVSKWCWQYQGYESPCLCAVPLPDCDWHLLDRRINVDHRGVRHVGRQDGVCVHPKHSKPALRYGSDSYWAHRWRIVNAIARCAPVDVAPPAPLVFEPSTSLPPEPAGIGGMG